MTITTIPLWTEPVPNSLGHDDKDIPTLTLYIPEKSGSATSAIVVCPGGGYRKLCFDYEGTEIGEWFRDRGVAGFVLKYRLPGDGYRHPVPLHDIQRAIRIIRSRAAEWNVNPESVGAIGFSAGGHLISTLMTHFDLGDTKAAEPVEHYGCRLNFAILVYPLVSLEKKNITHTGSRDVLIGSESNSTLVEDLSAELHVSPDSPPTLLIHGQDDGTVPIAHSRILHEALKKAGVPTEMHEYAHGPHGFGGGKPVPGNPAGWKEKAYDWLLTVEGCILERAFSGDNQPFFQSRHIVRLGS